MDARATGGSSVLLGVEKSGAWRCCPLRIKLKDMRVDSERANRGVGDPSFRPLTDFRKGGDDEGQTETDIWKVRLAAPETRIRLVFQPALSRFNDHTGKSNAGFPKDRGR